MLKFRDALASGVAAVVIVVLASFPAPASAAIQPKPHTDKSLYITSASTSDMDTRGCSAGQYDDNHGHIDRATILDFGGQYSDGSGTEPVLGPSKLTNSQIKAMAEAYAQGYYACGASGSRLYVAVGTNSSAGDVSYGGGQDWGRVVAAISHWVINANMGGRVLVYGANDIETGSKFSGPNPAKAWADGYSSISDAGFYYDFGDAGGCPLTTHDNGPCNNNWRQYGVWYVSWGASAALPMPEIYFSSMAHEWTQISWYGYAKQGGRLNIQGPLSENALDSSTLTATQAWNDLWTDLNAHTATAQSLTWSLGQRYE
jgi:hypothetical protein